MTQREWDPLYTNHVTWLPKPCACGSAVQESIDAPEPKPDKDNVSLRVVGTKLENE